MGSSLSACHVSQLSSVPCSFASFAGSSAERRQAARMRRLGRCTVTVAIAVPARQLALAVCL